jgi:hypothetical protein
VIKLPFHFAVAIIILAGPFAPAQDAGHKSGSTPPKGEAKKDAPKSDSTPVMALRFKVTVSGNTVIPGNSSLEIKASDSGCGNLERWLGLNAEGIAIASEIPVCKVAVWILITGLDAKETTLDLAS